MYDLPKRGIPEKFPEIFEYDQFHHTLRVPIHVMLRNITYYHHYIFLFYFLPELTYNPNHAAPAPTNIDSNPDCSIVGASRSRNHITT